MLKAFEKAKKDPNFAANQQKLQSPGTAGNLKQGL